MLNLQLCLLHTPVLSCAFVHMLHVIRVQLTITHFRFPTDPDVVIEADEPIRSTELPIIASSPNSECNDEGGDVEEAGGG